MGKVFDALRSAPPDASTRLATLYQVKAKLTETTGVQEHALMTLIDREVDLLKRYLIRV